MKLITFIISLSLFSIIAWTCSDEPTKPPPPTPTEPDTTTHEFTWQTYYFGDAQSYFQDVFAISDTDVWAVGHVFLRDSAGQIDIANPYNAVHWNGMMWKLVRVYEKPWTPSPLNCVFRIDTNAVWVGSSIPSKWDGNRWNHYGSQQGYPVGGWITKAWGNKSEMFFAGESGSITQWDGSVFRKMTTNTTIDLYDISGKYDGKIYACGGEFNGIVLAYDGAQWSAIDSLSDNGAIARWTVFATNGFFAVGGDDVRFIDTAYSKTLTKPPKEVLEGALKNGLPIGTICIRGSSRKNVFAVGSWQYVIHYNGKTWKWYDELWDETGHTQYAVSATNNSVFIAGYKNGRATILIGRRK